MMKVLRAIEIVMGLAMIVAGLFCVAWDGAAIYQTLLQTDPSCLRESFAPVIATLASGMVIVLSGSEKVAQYTAIVFMFGIWFTPLYFGWQIAVYGIPRGHHELPSRPIDDPARILRRTRVPLPPSCRN